MDQQPTSYEFGPKEQRGEVLGRLLYLSFGRFMKFVINLFISLWGLAKQFVKDAFQMLTSR